HAGIRRARSKFFVTHHAESASPPRVLQAPAPMRTPTKRALATEETSARPFLRKERELSRVEIKTSPATLPGKAPGFQSARALSDTAANATLAAGSPSTDFPICSPAASSGAGMRPNRRAILPR